MRNHSCPRIGINGFGRIGRAIFRSNLKHRKFSVVAVNDVNPEIANVVYQLNYDTTYGCLEQPYQVSGSSFGVDGHKVAYFNHEGVDQVPWQEREVDIVIDASGVAENTRRASALLAAGQVGRVVITHSPDEVDFTMVLGANQEEYRPARHRLISSSICDATAIAPALRLIHQAFGVENGYITTLHPWLNYQNLIDGPASSWSHPGEIYHHYALGRSGVNNMIPKPTSAIEATCKVLDGLTPRELGSFSYRTPLAIVGSADITLNLKRQARPRQIIERFEEAEQKQQWKIFKNNILPLVSNDFKQSEYSAVIDHRWTDVVGDRLLKLVLWYDNEWGYANRVIDQIEYIAGTR